MDPPPSAPGGTADIEGRAVRTLACVGLMMVGLAPVGCNTSGRQPPARDASPTDAAVGRVGDTTSSRSVAPVSGTGLLAGQVLDRYDRRASRATIQVVAAKDAQGKTAAPISVQTDEEGYFTIPGL